LLREKAARRVVVKDRLGVRVGLVSKVAVADVVEANAVAAVSAVEVKEAVGNAVVVAAAWKN
jgi:hypothetical protein